MYTSTLAILICKKCVCRKDIDILNTITLDTSSGNGFHVVVSLTQFRDILKQMEPISGGLFHIKYMTSQLFFLYRKTHEVLKHCSRGYKPAQGRNVGKIQFTRTSMEGGLGIFVPERVKKLLRMN